MGKIGLFLFCFVLMMGSVDAISLCIDNEDPGAPGNLAVSGESGSVLLAWTSAVDSPVCSGIAEYVISRDGVELGTVDSNILGFVDNESLGEGSYRYTVYAVDLVGGNAGASVMNDIVVEEGGKVSKGGKSSSSKCDVNWSCGVWSECDDGFMSRSCKDLNYCGTTNLRPDIYSECEVVDIGEEDRNESIELTTDAPIIGRGITGAVIGNLKSPGAGILIFMLMILVGGTYLWVRGKANKKIS